MLDAHTRGGAHDPRPPRRRHRGRLAYDEARQQLHTQAAQLCARHFGEDTERWCKWLNAFCGAGALAEVAPYVPVESPQ
eukprot:6724973-Prymnesium_polylepis.1